MTMPVHKIRWLPGFLALFILITSITVAQSGVQVVVVNEFLNIRVSPAIGSRVIDTVQAGFVFDAIDARSADSQWVRVEYQCGEGWINLVPTVQLQGDISILPVADPRFIPFGGHEAPRAGYTQQTNDISAKATDGLRLRSGPSRAYPTLANINFNQLFTITGRNNCGTWYQVSFEGILGWVSSAFVQVLNGDVNTAPVGGIIGESGPATGESEEDYIASLQFMLDRLNIAQESLDTMRVSWTDAALIGRAICQAYPPRPSDIHMPEPLVSAYYTTLNPLIKDFNDAMYNTRQVIDLFIEVCNQPGTANPVGQATVQGALNIINLAEQQYASLRERINELIPDFTIGPDQCLLRYNRKAEVVPRIELNTIYLDSFTRRTATRGYCFEGYENQVIDVQSLPIPPAELEVFVSISPLDDPANFVLVSRSAAGQRQVIGPLILSRTTTYLVIFADLGPVTGGDQERIPIGEFAFKVSDLTFGEATTVQCPNITFTCDQFSNAQEVVACYQAGNVSLDPNNDGIACDENFAVNVFTTSTSVINSSGTDLIYWDEATKSVMLEAGQTTTAQLDPLAGGIQSPSVVCPSLALTCTDLFTCEEAKACYNAGNLGLDGNGDGIPCENLCG